MQIIVLLHVRPLLSLSEPFSSCVFTESKFLIHVHSEEIIMTNTICWVLSVCQALS